MQDGRRPLLFMKTHWSRLLLPWQTEYTSRTLVLDHIGGMARHGDDVPALWRGRRSAIVQPL